MILNYRSLIVIAIIFFIMILSSIILLSMADSKISNKPRITDFETCLQAGFPAEESSPRRCHDKAGHEFVEMTPVPESSIPNTSACVDRCGDNTCQEVVCAAVGCACPETSQSCPQDCPAEFGFPN